MKRVLVCLVLLCGIRPLFATVEQFYHYNYSHLQVTLIANHEEWEPFHILYYQGMMHLANEYIVQRIAQHTWADDQFNVTILSPMFGSQHPLKLTRTPSGYAIYLNRKVSLQYLVRLLEYCHSSAWQPFELISENRKMWQDTLAVFHRRVIEQVADPQLEAFTGKQVPLWSVGELVLVYTPDTLLYQYQGEPIAYPPEDVLPVRLHDRYFMMNAGTLYVQNFDADTVMNSIAIPEYFAYYMHNSHMESYRSWMNFYYNNRPILSYAYTTNRFYLLSRFTDPPLKSPK